MAQNQTLTVKNIDAPNRPGDSKSLENLLIEKLANDISEQISEESLKDRRWRRVFGFIVATFAVTFSYVILWVLYSQITYPSSWFNSIASIGGTGGKLAQFALVSGSFLNFIVIHAAVIRSMFQSPTEASGLNMKDLLEIIQKSANSGGE